MLVIGVHLNVCRHKTCLWRVDRRCLAAVRWSFGTETLARLEPEAVATSPSSQRSIGFCDEETRNPRNSDASPARQ